MVLIGCVCVHDIRPWKIWQKIKFFNKNDKRAKGLKTMAATANITLMWFVLDMASVPK